MVLLYGRNIWVMTGAMLKVLEGFHHRADRRIVGMTAQSTEEGEWEYHLVADALEAALAGRSRNTFRYGRPPLHRKCPAGQYMRCALGRKGLRGIVG